MADEQRKNPQPAARPAGPEPIHVRELRARREDDRIPAPGRSNILQAGRRQSGDTILIQYEPWQRHHRVREIGEDGKVKTEVCIPEGWVAYTPAADEA
jgi:hypothetical protein